MYASVLNEADMNAMILDLMENKNKNKKVKTELIKDIKKQKKKKIKKNENEETEYKRPIKNNLIMFLKDQQQIYKQEKTGITYFIKSQIEEKEKELNTFYKYCQNYKKNYKDNYNDVMQNSEEIKKELKDLQIEYLDKKIDLENQRRMELKTASDFYKEKLIDVKNQWDKKTFCDDNLKTLVFDILNVMN